MTRSALDSEVDALWFALDEPKPSFEVVKSISSDEDDILLNHYIDAVGIDKAQLIADHLHGFETSIDTSPFYNGIGPARYQIKATEVYIPNNQTTPEMAVERGRRVIGRVIDQVPGSHDSDSPMGLPLPLRS